MKHIAVSLGSLSLLLLQNGHCENQDLNDNTPLSVTEPVAHEFLQQGEIQDPLFLIDENASELENELLSLEEELENEQFLESQSHESAALKELAFVESSPTVDDAVMTEESSAVLSEISLEETHTPISHEGSPGSDKEKSEETALSDKGTTTPASELVATKQDLLIANVSEELSDGDDEFESDEVSLQESPANETSIAQQKEIVEMTSSPVQKKGIQISFKEVFSGSPTIYLSLLFLSIVSVVIWLYNFITLNQRASTKDDLMKNVRNRLLSNHYQEAIDLCKQDTSFFAQMIASGVSSRKYGLQFMLESMKSEGKRASVSYWQRLNLLHDIAIVAPMIGLLGTVLGMFYAFYDLNRSFESITSLFDGLGVSVGTTVAGIFVAILAMILHSAAKYRLVKSLTFVENEAVALAHLIENKQGQ
jgi:biopolymer transport protein ExbB